MSLSDAAVWASVGAVNPKASRVIWPAVFEGRSRGAGPSLSILGSARLGSARLGSARLGSARLGSARLGDMYMCLCQTVPNPRERLGCAPRKQRKVG
ncbi:hypothetical protein D5038_15190 [Verminephrobacter aporrectodeae subsp. tuberculatae]|nr:hypothetical protein [Verminephrobacter aporrectodeae subsp. tuberculatae]